MNRKEIAQYVKICAVDYFTNKNYVLNSEVELHQQQGKRKKRLRVDLIGINSKVEIVIVEVKSSVSDFTSDKKLHLYQEFCDRFYVAAPEDVCEKIKDMLPKGAGLLSVSLPTGKMLRASRRNLVSKKNCKKQSTCETLRNHVLLRFAFRNAQYNRIKRHQK